MKYIQHLSFIKVSSVLGGGKARKNKIDSLNLPGVLKHALMFSLNLKRSNSKVFVRKRKHILKNDVLNRSPADFMSSFSPSTSSELDDPISPLHSGYSDFDSEIEDGISGSEISEDTEALIGSLETDSEENNE